MTTPTTMTLLLLTTTLATGFSAKSRAVPVLEQQFYTSVKLSQYQDGALFSEVSYDMYLDKPNQRYRQTEANRTMVADYKNNVFFILSNGVCTIMPPPSTPPATQIIDPRATDLGPTTVTGGEAAELWRAKYQDTSKNAINHTLDAAVQTKPAAGFLPVRLVINDTFHFGFPGSFPPGCMCKPMPCTPKPCLRSVVSDYSNGLHVGPMSDSLFAQPTGCTPRKLTEEELLDFKWL